jgi:hypothetical protein
MFLQHVDGTGGDLQLGEQARGDDLHLLMAEAVMELRERVRALEATQAAR